MLISHFTCTEMMVRNSPHRLESYDKTIIDHNYESIPGTAKVRRLNYERFKAAVIIEVILSKKKGQPDYTQ